MTILYHHNFWILNKINALTFCILLPPGGVCLFSALNMGSSQVRQHHIIHPLAQITNNTNIGGKKPQNMSDEEQEHEDVAAPSHFENSTDAIGRAYTVWGQRSRVTEGTLAPSVDVPNLKEVLHAARESKKGDTTTCQCTTYQHTTCQKSCFEIYQFDCFLSCDGNFTVNWIILHVLETSGCVVQTGCH